jgi:hypothetical protein
LSEGLRLLAELLALEVWGDEQEGEVRKALATLLSALPEASVLGTELINAIWRQTPMAAIEAPVFRRIDGQDCVFLALREPGEAYAGLLHCPGTIVRTADESWQGALARLAGEFGMRPGSLVLVSSQPVEVRLVEEARGRMLSLLFSVGISGDPAPETGSWVPVGEIAGRDDIIPDHAHGLIPRAYWAWKGH